MQNLLIIDPKKYFNSDIDFSTVHYYHRPSWCKDDEYCWMIWLGDKKEKTTIELFYNEETDSEYEAPFTQSLYEVKGMIELQRSVFDSNVMWLKFFEVCPNFKGQGFSKVMIDDFIREFKSRFPNETLSRSRPSEEGELKLKNNFTDALNKANVKFMFSQ